MKVPQRATIGLAIGAVTSIALMLHAGRHQRSIVLILLFSAWVVSPFLGLLCADLISKRWLPSARIMLNALTLAVVFICPGIYAAVAFGYTTLKMGFVFLVVPFACWILIALLVAVALVSSHRASRQINAVNRN
ncbi:MAG: hypothetical protein ACJ746_00645 [Bryobacteraceae bacterium]